MGEFKTSQVIFKLVGVDYVIKMFTHMKYLLEGKRNTMALSLSDHRHFSASEIIMIIMNLFAGTEYLPPPPPYQPPPPQETPEQQFTK